MFLVEKKESIYRDTYHLEIWQSLPDFSAFTLALASISLDTAAFAAASVVKVWAASSLNLAWICSSVSASVNLLNRAWISSNMLESEAEAEK